MQGNPSFSLRLFRSKAARTKGKLRRFLSRIEKNPPVRLQSKIENLEKEVWIETDCLSCANCCKTMTPTYTAKDISRIATHFKMTPAAFKKKWLKKDRTGDWMNKHTPCQFLDNKTNKCSIYAIRPADCSGFPHLTKRKMTDYIHVHKQNLESYPATYRMVEKMIENVNGQL